MNLNDKCSVEPMNSETNHVGLPLRVIEALSAVFRCYPAISEVILYGSRAMGTYRDSSDIDLTLKGDGLDLSLLLAVENQVDDLLLPWGVDLSLFDAIDNDDLRAHILRCGVVFYAG